MHQSPIPNVSEVFRPSCRYAQAIISISCVLTFILVLFSDFIPTPFGGYADQRFFLMAVSGLLVVVPVSSFAAELAVTPSRVWVFLPTLVLCLAFVALSIPFGSQAYVWVEPGMYAFYFLAAIASGACLAWTGASAAFARFFICAMAATCLIYGLTSVNVYLFAIFDGVTDLIDFIPWGFMNIRYWSHIATWCLPLMPLSVLVGPLKAFRSWRVAVLLGAGMWWWVLFLTAGRGSAMGIAFGVILAGLLFGRRALPWLKVFITYLAVGILIWLLLSVLIPTLLSDEGVHIRTVHAGDSGRIALFIEAWHMSLQNFPLGMGPQSWLTHERLTEAYSAAKKFGHPHNMYLMWAAEYGWTLIAALGVMVAQAICYFWKSRSAVLSETADEKSLMLAAITASVSAALFHAGVSAVFMAPGSMLVGLFVLIAFWAQIIPAQPAPASATGQQKGSILQGIIAIAVCAALFVGWIAWAQDVWIYYQDMRKDEEFRYGEVSEGMLPRFWFHGNFPR